MDYAIVYVKEKKLSNRLIAPINQVQLFKKMKLPYELFGFNEDSMMKEAREVKLKSCLKWKRKLIEVPTLSRKSIEIWENFVI